MSAKLVMVLLLGSSICFAKPKYDHIGKMIYHAPQVKDLLEGRTDLFYEDSPHGDYICTPGDEHHAPDCRQQIDWLLVLKESYVEIELDDGTSISITNHQIGDDFSEMVNAWQQKNAGLQEGEASTFVYRLHKGRIEVEPSFRSDKR